MPLASGSVVDGRYELGDVIGRGGMAEVRRAHDLKLGRDVAVKLLRQDLAEQAGARRRFEDEASAAARLNHPNAVTVLDTGEDDGVPFIVMECLPGRTLADELMGGECLPIDRVRRIGGEVLSALAAAHDLGIVHRDVKPANVLLCDDGSVKVADFGIAKTTEGLDLTTTGQLVGTPNYMAPERLHGRPATPQSDLYAVGVLLYEAAGGRKPFGGDSAVAVAAAIAAGRPVALADLNAEVDGVMAATVHRALATAPDDRFGSAREMAAALAGVEGGPATRVFAAVPIDDATSVVSAVPLSSEPRVQSPRSGPQVDRLRRTADVALIRRVLIGAGLALLAVVLFASFRDDGSSPSGPTTPSTSLTTVAAVPAPLDSAIDHLEETVRR